MRPEAVGLVGDGIGRPDGRVAGGRAILERLREAADDGQGRAQIVADVGQQLTLCLARGADLGGHGVEGRAGARRPRWDRSPAAAQAPCPAATSLVAAASWRSGRVTERLRPTARGMPMTTQDEPSRGQRADQVGGRLRGGIVIGACEHEERRRRRFARPGPAVGPAMGVVA